MRQKKTGRIFEIMHQEGQKRYIPLLAFFVDDVMKKKHCVLIAIYIMRARIGPRNANQGMKHPCAAKDIY